LQGIGNDARANDDVQNVCHSSFPLPDKNLF